VNTID